MNCEDLYEDVGEAVADGIHELIDQLEIRVALRKTTRFCVFNSTAFIVIVCTATERFGTR